MGKLHSFPNAIAALLSILTCNLSLWQLIWLCPTVLILTLPEWSFDWWQPHNCIEPAPRAFPAKSHDHVTSQESPWIWSSLAAVKCNEPSILIWVDQDYARLFETARERDAGRDQSTKFSFLERFVALMSGCPHIPECKLVVHRLSPNSCSDDFPFEI